MSSARPEELLDRPIPDLELPGSDGANFRFRDPAASPLVLFFYVRNASPG